MPISANTTPEAARHLALAAMFSPTNYISQFNFPVSANLRRELRHSPHEIGS